MTIRELRELVNDPSIPEEAEVKIDAGFLGMRGESFVADLKEIRTFQVLDENLVLLSTLGEEADYYHPLRK